MNIVKSLRTVFYRTPPVASADLLFLIKNNVGWFVDLVRVRYLHTISSKPFQQAFSDLAAENKNLSKVKHCSKGCLF